MNQYTSHNKICYACGEERPRRALGYDVRTLKSYCKKDCPKQELIPNVELIELTSEDLSWALEQAYPQEIVDQFEKLLGKVVSTRPVPALVMHLMKTAQANGFKSVNATLQFILERDFAAHEVKGNLEGVNFKRSTALKKTKEQKEIERLKAELEKVRAVAKGGMEPYTEGLAYDEAEKKNYLPSDIEEGEPDTAEQSEEEHQRALSIALGKSESEEEPPAPELMPYHENGEVLHLTSEEIYERELAKLSNANINEPEPIKVKEDDDFEF